MNRFLISSRVAVLMALTMTLAMAGCSKPTGAPTAPEPKIDLSRSITQEQVRRVKKGMTVAAIEAILDEGRAPDRSFDWASMNNYMRRWGDSNTWIELHFLNGRVVGYRCQNCITAESEDERDNGPRRGRGR